MKKTVLVFVLLFVSLIAGSVYAQTVGITEPEKPPFDWKRTKFEIGFDLGVGFENDLLGVGDIFKETIDINFIEWNNRMTQNGFNLHLAPAFDFFFNVNMGGNWGGGFFLGLDGDINAQIPKSLFTLLAEGNLNEHSPDGDFAVSGAVFAAMEIEVHGKLKSLKKLKFGITPGVFVPVAYVPKSIVSYHLNTDEDAEGDPKLSVSTSGAVDVYTPLSLETMADPVGSVLSSGGFDISLAGEYALFEAQKWGSLAVGGTIEHIPFFPATLSNKMTVTMDNDKIITGKGGEEDVHLMTGDFEFHIPDAEITHGTANRKVVRPMRVDFYMVYQPFATDWLTVTPNLGFTVLTPGDPSLNFGLSSQVNFRHLIGLRLGTGFDEWVWKHQAGLIFNFRAFELDLDVALHSQDFVESFRLSGLSAKAGLRFGW